MAYVVKHKANEERSSYYDKLMAAEFNAKDKGKALFSGDRDPEIWRINDISYEQGARTQQFFVSLKEKKLQGIVEKVHSGGRVKLWIPKQSLMITFALSGVSSPSVSKKGDSKPFAQEAKDFANKNLILKEVDIVIDFCDKFGTFLGALYLKNKNYAVDLVKNGYGYLNASARRLEYHEELEKAEEAGIKSGKNLFSLTEQERDPKGYQRRQERLNKPKEERPNREERETSGISESANRNPMKIRITEVVDATHVFLQTANSSAALSEIDELIGELDLEKEDSSFSPSSGDYCLCQYSGDSSWYRAKVLSADSKNDSYKVFYIDYGNSERVKLESLRPLSGPSKLLNIKAQAKEAFLAFVNQAPKLYREFSNEYVYDFTMDKDLSAIHEYTEEKKIFITIYDGEKNLNKELIKSGLAFVTKDAKITKKFKDTISEYSDAQSYAINHRVYLWEKGEIYDGEEEEEQL